MKAENGQKIASMALTVLALAILCGVLAQFVIRLLDTLSPSPLVPATALSNATDRQAPQYDLQTIQRARLFGEEAMAEATEILEQTSLRITVDGLLVSDEPGQSLAFLTMDGEQRAYRQGELINDDNDIVFEAISDGQVVIRYLGQLQQVPYTSREQ